MKNAGNNSHAPDRVCLITGAGGQLGQMFCETFRDRYAIAAMYRTRLPRVVSQTQSLVDPLEPARPLIENSRPIFTVQADVSDEIQVTRGVAMVLAHYGRIDLVVNGAAAFAARGMDHECFIQDAYYQVSANLIGPALVSGVVHRLFWRDKASENRALNRGIINISSISGLHVYPGIGQSIYAASKAGLNHLTLHMAHEYAKIGIRVNAIAPNSFPSVIPTESVASAIAELDEGTLTGKIVVLDAPKAESPKESEPRAQSPRQHASQKSQV
jgi:NAD(P)-dependent dehydrogenase (short-subunit alcohol dehydrogenase family)